MHVFSTVSQSYVGRLFCLPPSGLFFRFFFYSFFLSMLWLVRERFVCLLPFHVSTPILAHEREERKKNACRAQFPYLHVSPDIITRFGKLIELLFIVWLGVSSLFLPLLCLVHIYMQRQVRLPPSFSAPLLRGRATHTGVELPPRVFIRGERGCFRPHPIALLLAPGVRLGRLRVLWPGAP